MKDHFEFSFTKKGKGVVSVYKPRFVCVVIYEICNNRVEMSFDLVGSKVQFSGSNLRKFLLTGQKKIITTEQNYRIKFVFFKLHKSQQIKRLVYKPRHL
jgi:hypothetical protein